MKRILMANDLSARSDRALRRAVSLAREHSAHLEVVTIVEPIYLESSMRHSQNVARQALTEQLAALPDATGVTIAHDVIVGTDFEEIIHRSEEIDADLVVLGIHRHKPREMFRGTTAERVVRCGTRPVLVVKDPVTGPYRRVVVPSDLSEHSQAAALTAARLAPRGDLTLLHAVHRPFAVFLARPDQDTLMTDYREGVKGKLAEVIRHVSDTLGEAAPKMEIVFREGEISSAILAQVELSKTDLLAVGTHGRSGLAHAIIGSVAEDLLADCPVDVLAAKAS